MSQTELIPDPNSKKYPSLLIITENGYGKSTHLTEYRKTNRAAGGVKTLNLTSKTGKPIISIILEGNEEDLFITTKNGITIRISLDDVPQLGRITQGVKVIRLEDGDFVTGGSVN